MLLALVQFSCAIEYWQKWTKSGVFKYNDAPAVVMDGLPVIGGDIIRRLG